MLFLKISLLLAFLYLAYEDLRYRAISYISLGALSISSIAYSIISLGLKPAFSYALINLILISIQLGATFLYFAIKQKKWRNIVNHYIGSGDILFYLPVIFLFSPFNFIFIQIVALVIVLVCVVLFKTAKKPILEIPLAGGLAIILALTLLVSWNFKSGLLFDDLFLSDLLYTLSS